MPDNGKCKVYVAVSGKGGAGKSTVVCGLGLALSERGFKTLLIDADEGLRCLDLMLGLSEKVMFDLGDVLDGRCTADKAVLSVPRTDRLYLMPAPLYHGTVAGRLTDLIQMLRGDYDCILIDATAGVGKGFESAVRAADSAIVVVGCDPVSIRDARNVCELLEDAGLRSRRMIINRFDYRQVRSELAPQIDKMIDDTALRLIGIVPYDGALAVGAINGRPVTRGRAYRAFGRIAARLAGKNLRLPRLKKI